MMEKISAKEQFADISDDKNPTKCAAKPKIKS